MWHITVLVGLLLATLGTANGIMVYKQQVEGHTKQGNLKYIIQFFLAVHVGSTLMLNIRQKKCSSIQVRWTPPVNTTSMIHYSSSVHNGTVKNYSMQQNSQQPHTKTVKGLVVGTNYIISVTVHYMDGTEESEHKTTRTMNGSMYIQTVTV